jgi:magnesium transporter
MQLRALCRTGGADWAEVDDLSKISELRRDPGVTVWAEADLSGAGREDIRALAQEFALDDLAVEDALNPRQRPKLESYDPHLLMVLFQLDEVEDQLEPRQIACFAGGSFLLMLHHGADRLIGETRRRLEAGGPEIGSADRMLHAVADVAVDDYENIATGISDEVEELEGQALEVARAEERTTKEIQGSMPSQYRLYTLKQQTSMLRRFALPVSLALQRIQAQRGVGERPEPLPVPRETQKLFRDVDDHVQRVSAQIRNIEDLIQGVLDLTQSVQADTLNEINKKLTGWAAIIAAPALIVGLYGINYKLLPFPDFFGRWGFLFVLGLMAGASLSLYALFKRKGWI